jgi:hypothetical protein
MYEIFGIIVWNLYHIYVETVTTEVKPLIFKHGSIAFYNYWIHYNTLFTVNVQDDLAS